jgi:hypothetical protein
MTYAPPKARLEDLERNDYRHSETLARWTIWLLYALIVVTVGSIVSGLLDRQVLQLGGELYTDETAQRTMLVASAQLLVFIASGTLCLCWIYRMAYNARIRAKHMQYSPGWSVGWYFIPIAYWWKPYQAMKEIWSNSAQQAGPRGDESGTLLGWWWALWISQTLVSNASFRLGMNASSLDNFLIANLLELIGNVLQVPLCIVFIVMVRRLTAMQEYAYEHPEAMSTVRDMREF